MNTRILLAFFLVLTSTLNAQEGKISKSELSKVQLNNVLPLGELLGSVKVPEIKELIVADWTDNIKESPFVTTTWAISTEGLYIYFEELEDESRPWYLLSLNILNASHTLHYQNSTLKIGSPRSEVINIFEGKLSELNHEITVACIDFPASLTFGFGSNELIEYIEFKIYN